MKSLLIILVLVASTCVVADDIVIDPLDPNNPTPLSGTNQTSVSVESVSLSADEAEDSE